MKTKVKLLKALAHDIRLQIIQHLIDDEKCACTIKVGKAQSTVSGHLKILEEAQILSSRRVGTNIWYKVKSKDTLQILKILNINKIKSKKLKNLVKK
jgi:DNA-binding transcriptional ArsR family regulator